MSYSCKAPFQVPAPPATKPRQKGEPPESVRECKDAPGSILAGDASYLSPAFRWGRFGTYPGEMTTETAAPNQADASTAFLRAARAGQIEKIISLLEQGVDINVSNANGLNAIHLASKDGHVEVVRELLERGAAIDAATKKGNTALHIASLAGQEAVVKLLVQNGAQVNIQSQNGFTPLYMAAQENHDGVVKFLLANGANQSLATEDGFTPLAVAMQQGHEKVVAVLLEADTRGRVRLPALHIAAKKDDVKAANLLLENEHNPDVTSKSGFTPLHIAAHYGNEAVARLLLAKGADVNCAAKHNICPLHVAAKWGKENMVALLCDNGANVEARTRDGLTPLHCAARSGHERVVETLLDRGAPITSKSKNGLAPLHMAAQGDHAEAARVLLSRRAPVDDVTVDYLTALHVAAHCGHAKVAKLLLDRNADANARALNGFTPLHIACKKNRIKVVELLLKYGASIQATTESGLTPLHVAAFMGCMNIVIYLLQHEANPDVPTVRGETPLHLAARANQTDIIRILLRNGAAVEAKARERQTPLHIASRLGNVDIAVLLLQHGADVRAMTADHYNALHIAAKQHNHDVAAALIEHNAPLTATTKKGFTALHLAAKYGNLKVANLLLAHGASPDQAGKNGMTPLHIAAQYDQQAVATTLLEKGADAKAVAKNGHTPLHIAARKNQMETAATLLEYGALTNAESKAGFTPLHLAAQQGHAEMCSLLLEHGAEVDQQAKNGLSAFHLSAQEDRVSVAQLLMKNGGQVDICTKGGYTPLHIASHYGQANMVRYLLENGASVKAQTNHGYTALHHAAQQGHINIVNILLEHKADPNATTVNGQTPLDISSKLGYVTVMETLKEVSDPSIAAASQEKYKVVAPETMLETFMSDSEEEGGEDTILNDQPYRYLTVDDMKSLGDDSLPIDVTKDERTESAMSHKNIMEISQGSVNGIPYQPQQEVVVKSISHYSTAQAPKGYCYNVDPTQPKKKLQWKNFLVSFLVDARGGAMRGCRGGGVRVIVPPLSAQQPTRITCRYLKPSRINHMPPLMEGEALASRVLEMGPVSAKFLGPVILEVPHYASLRGKEREIVILRSDNGTSWREHNADATEDVVQDILHETLEIEDANEDDKGWDAPRVTRILTHDFPQYFAVISRIRQEVHAIGPEGGMVSSSVVPQVQAVFPQGALTKKIKVGLQAQIIDSELTAKLLGRGVAVSPVVTVEPRRRKFHKAITLSMPAPRPHTQGMTNQYSTSSAPTLRLLCSISAYVLPTPATTCYVSKELNISGGTNRAHWEDVTENTPLTFVNDCVSFTTTVSARYWLIDCRHVEDATKMATELYREAIHVPFMARFVVYAKRTDECQAQLRMFCVTDDKEDKALERIERFIQVAKSRDVEVHEGKPVYLEFGGNLVPVAKSGEQLSIPFRAFRENRIAFPVMIKTQDLEPICRCQFMRDPKVPKGEPSPSPIAVLNIMVPDDIPAERISPIQADTVPRRTEEQELIWQQRLSDPRLEDICNLLGKDWVALAYELGVSVATVNQIQAKRITAAEQAQLMLKLWKTQSGTKALDNSLELALCRIGRDDIIAPQSEITNERRIQRNIYQERQASEEIEAYKAEEDNKLKEKIDDDNNIAERLPNECELDQDEAKYSPEEKSFVDKSEIERTPSLSEDSEEDEDVKRSVAERKEQITKKLSSSKIPASKQKKEIREEIIEIKTQIKPDIKKFHGIEQQAKDKETKPVSKTPSETVEDEKEIVDTNDLLETKTEEIKPEKLVEQFRKFDPSSPAKPTPKHLQRHMRNESMRFPSGDFSNVTITPRKTITVEATETQKGIDVKADSHMKETLLISQKEIDSAKLKEKLDDGDKSPELVMEYTEKDIAEAPLRDKISSFESKISKEPTFDATKTVKLTKEALKKHTLEQDRSIEYTQEFVRDQSKQISVETHKQSIQQTFETERHIETVKSVKDTIQHFDIKIKQEEKAKPFPKTMRTDSTLVQVSSEEDSEFLKKSTDSETETESQTTIKIEKDKLKSKIDQQVFDEKPHVKHERETKPKKDQDKIEKDHDQKPDDDSDKKDGAMVSINNIKIEKQLTQELRSKVSEEEITENVELKEVSIEDKVETQGSIASTKSDISKHTKTDSMGSDVQGLIGHKISQDSPAQSAIEKADSIADLQQSTEKDVSFISQTESKVYSKPRSDSLDEASQFSDLEDQLGTSPAHKPIADKELSDTASKYEDKVLSVTVAESEFKTSKEQTIQFLKSEITNDTLLPTPSVTLKETEMTSLKESPVISAKARQFIETVPEDDSVQECFFSKRIYSDSLEDSEHTDSRRHSEADSLKSDQSDFKAKVSSSDFDERAEYEETADSGSGFGDEKFEESVGFTAIKIDPKALAYDRRDSDSDKVEETETIFKKVVPKRHSRTESISISKLSDLKLDIELSKPSKQEFQVIVTEAEEIDKSFERDEASEKISSESSREVEISDRKSSEGISDRITSEDAVTDKKTSSEEEVLKEDERLMDQESDKDKQFTMSLQKTDIKSTKEDIVTKVDVEKRQSVTSAGSSSISELRLEEKRPSDAHSLTESRDYTFEESEDDIATQGTHVDILKEKSDTKEDKILEGSVKAVESSRPSKLTHGDSLDDVEGFPEDHAEYVHKLPHISETGLQGDKNILQELSKEHHDQSKQADKPTTYKTITKITQPLKETVEEEEITKERIKPVIDDILQKGTTVATAKSPVLEKDIKIITKEIVESEKRSYDAKVPQKEERRHSCISPAISLERIAESEVETEEDISKPLKTGVTETFKEDIQTGIKKSDSAMKQMADNIEIIIKQASEDVDLSFEEVHLVEEINVEKPEAQDLDGKVSVDSIIEEAVNTVQEYLESKDKEIEGRILEEHLQDDSKRSIKERPSLMKSLSRDSGEVIILPKKKQTRTFSVQSSPEEVEEQIYTDSESDMDKAKVLEIIEPSSDIDGKIPISSFDTRKLRTDSLDDADDIPDKEAEDFAEEIKCFDQAESLNLAKEQRRRDNLESQVASTSALQMDNEDEKLSSKIVKKTQFVDSVLRTDLVSKSTTESSVTTVISTLTKSSDEDQKSVVEDGTSADFSKISGADLVKDLSKTSLDGKEEYKIEEQLEDRVYTPDLSKKSIDLTKDYSKSSIDSKDTSRDFATNELSKDSTADLTKDFSKASIESVKESSKSIDEKTFSEDHSSFDVSKTLASDVSEGITMSREFLEEERSLSKVIKISTSSSQGTSVLTESKVCSDQESFGKTKTLEKHYADVQETSDIEKNALLLTSKVEEYSVYGTNTSIKGDDDDKNIISKEDTTDEPSNEEEDMPDMKELNRRCSNLLEDISSQGALIRIDSSHVTHDLTSKFSKTPPPSPVDLILKDKGKMGDNSDEKQTGIQLKETLTEASKVLSAASRPKSPTKHLSDNLSFINVDQPTITSGAIELVDRTIEKSIDVIDQIKKEQIAVKMEEMQRLIPTDNFYSKSVVETSTSSSSIHKTVEGAELKFQSIDPESVMSDMVAKLGNVQDDFSTILSHKETETRKISGQEFYSETKHVSSSDDDSLVIKTETKHELRGQEHEVKQKSTVRKDGDQTETLEKKLEKAHEATAKRSDVETKTVFKSTDDTDIIKVEREFTEQGLYTGRQTKSEEKMTAIKDETVKKKQEVKISEREMSHEQWGKEYFTEPGELEDVQETDEKSRVAFVDSSLKIIEKDEVVSTTEISEKDASETLVPSANELKEELMESSTYVEQFLHEAEKEGISKTKDISDEEISGEDEENKDDNIEPLGKMKRSHEMRFQPKEMIPEHFPLEGTSESIDLDDDSSKDKEGSDTTISSQLKTDEILSSSISKLDASSLQSQHEKEVVEEDLKEQIIVKHIREEEATPFPVTKIDKPPRKMVDVDSQIIPVGSTEYIEINKFGSVTTQTKSTAESPVVKTEIQTQESTPKENWEKSEVTEECIKKTVTEVSAVPFPITEIPPSQREFVDFEAEIIPVGTKQYEEISKSKSDSSVPKTKAEKTNIIMSESQLESKQSSTSSLKTHEHMSTPHTPLSAPSQSSLSTENGREYVLDDIYDISETPELKSEIANESSRSELVVTTEEKTLRSLEKEQESPTSDEFEIVDKPSEIDDFVVIEEVAKEAQETDPEGKSVKIVSHKYVKRHDDEVEEYLSKTSKKQDSSSASGSLSDEELLQYEIEQKKLQAQELAEIEAGKRWIQMQFEGDPRYDYERIPLEDIKEEEMTDFDASRIGSLSSQKESIGSYGSFRNSYGSLSESEMASRIRFRVRGENDDISISSLQEFENLERALMEQYQQHSSSSQDSLNGSLPRRYILSRSQGDDMSVSSLKEFEGLESACLEALKAEILAKQKEALLQADPKIATGSFLEQEKRSYSSSSDSSPPLKSGSPGQKTGSPSQKGGSPSQKIGSYGSPSQRLLADSAAIRKLIDQQMALEQRIQEHMTPKIVTVQKYDERGAFFVPVPERETSEDKITEAVEECKKSSSFVCAAAPSDGSAESIPGDCEEMMKILDQEEKIKRHQQQLQAISRTFSESGGVIEVVRTTTVIQQRFVDGKKVSETVTSMDNDGAVDIPSRPLQYDDSCMSLGSEMSSSLASQPSEMDSLMTVMEKHSDGDTMTVTKHTITALSDKPEDLDFSREGSSIRELSPSSGRSVAHSVTSYSGKHFTDPASGSWSCQDEELSSSGSFSRGARADLMLGSTDSLEATSSNATRATFNYEVDTPMTGSLTSGGSNTMVSSLDTLDPITAVQMESLEHQSSEQHSHDYEVQPDQDTEKLDADGRTPKAKERTIMFDSTDTLSVVSADSSVREATIEAPAPTFYIGDTPILRGEKKEDDSPQPVLSGSCPASLPPTTHSSPPIPAQRRSLTMIAKSPLSSLEEVAKK
ncbi:unnamed protein product, partial [Iphiclides podalirius]